MVNKYIMSKIKHTLLTTFFILVLGCNSSNEDEMMSFQPEVNQPPLSFSLLEIPNGEINVTLNPELKWEVASDPNLDNVSYDVLLEENNENPVTVIASNLQTTSLLIDVSLQFNTRYFWRVNAKDTKGEITNSQVFSFKTRNLKVVEATNNAAFSLRSNHTILEFKGKMWVIGGQDGTSASNDISLRYLNDLWSSSDGINWTEEVPNTHPNSFIGRIAHTSVVFNDKIWVIGGQRFNAEIFDAEILNDIWSSSDGINWKKEVDNAPFSKRYEHTSVVFKNKIWVIGGRGENHYENDEVWSSVDGINWVLETDNPPFLSRFGHTNVVFDDKIWIIAGINSVQGTGKGVLNDVWSSADGKKWRVATLDAGFSKREGHSSAVYKDKIWVIAGDLHKDIWSSPDGINWKEEIQNANFKDRGYQAMTFFDNRLWMAGGWSGNLLNDVWYFE